MTPTIHRILVIEDNPGDLRLLREALRVYSVDHELIHYERADEAIRAIDRFAFGQALPHLFLIDFNVPGGDARDILGALSRNPALAGIPAAVVTSSVAPQDREQAMKLGAKCFIIKPSGLDQFLSEVGTTVARLLGCASVATR